MTNKGRSWPSTEFATGQAVVKGEDILVARPRVSFPRQANKSRLSKTSSKFLSDSASSVHLDANGLQSGLPGQEHETKDSPALLRHRQGSLQGTGSFGLYCIFDGHNGAFAAQHLEEALLLTLENKLPAGHPPSEGDEPAYTIWREQLQRALVESFCDLNEEFACKGQLAGSTITVVLQYGWLLTVANCGDSRALLDTCHEIMQLTVDHRISTHQADRRRLQALGAQIAPIDGSGSGPAVSAVGYGPLRVWPGGLCLSRAIGDFDIGPAVIACPHLYQVRLPDTGGRLILASDGIWDGFENMKRLCRMSRGWSCQAAPQKTIQSLQRAFGGLRDDTSIIVLDILPPQTNFSDLAQQTPKRQPSTGSCFCFAPSTVELDGETVAATPKVTVHVELDVAAAIGLMPASNQAACPVWCEADFCSSISQSQAAACEAWQEARTIRSKGKTPSRQDLAGFFSAVHPLKPLPDAAKIDIHDLDVSTRPTLPKDAAEVATSQRASLFPAAGAVPEAKAAGNQGDASTRFSEHVADQISFARKFGHYKNQIGDGRSDEGSTTEEDSMRAGTQHEDLSDESQHGQVPISQTKTTDVSWSSSPPKRLNTSSPPQISKLGLYQLDSAMIGSPGSLPTVEEEKPSQRKLSAGPLYAAEEDETKPQAAELAVRRGKNRFTAKGQDTTLSSAPGKAEKPPLPKQHIVH